jgi:predicted nucleic acid-binding protein
MKGYLLDNNAISDWLDETKPRHAAVSRKAEQVARDEAIILTSCVVLGEIEHGVAAVRLKSPGSLEESRLADLRAQIDRQFVERRLLLNVSRSTALVYGDIRARLFDKFALKSKRKKERAPEQLTDPVCPKELGIEENDLWIAAQAIERNLILVTNDKMPRIRQVTPELRTEDWSVASP